MASEDGKYIMPNREPIGNGDGQGKGAEFSPSSAPSPRQGGPGFGGPPPPERQFSAPVSGEPSPYKRAPPPPERPYAEGPPVKRHYNDPDAPGGHFAPPPDGPPDYAEGSRGGYRGGRGGSYRGRGGYGEDGGPPGGEYEGGEGGYAPRGGRPFRARGAGHYDRGGRGGRGRGHGEWAEPPPYEGGPPERFPPDPPTPTDTDDRPNISVYPPRDESDAKPSFEVYPPREGSVGPPERRPPPPEAPSAGGASAEYGPPPAASYEGGGYEGRGRPGYYRYPRSRGRPPFFRGRGRGYEGYSEEGEEAGRGRGWVDRGRGWVDRGRGDRGRGWVDRGRGWVDRGRGDRGRGWVDRGRGWVDRGRGWVDRGRGWVDRGRGGWVDRGRGGWVDRGRGGFDRGRGRGRGNIEFDKTGEYMWDEKNSCWKKVPQHWKQQMQEQAAAAEKGQFDSGGPGGPPPRPEWRGGPPDAPHHGGGPPGPEWAGGPGGHPPGGEWGPPGPPGGQQKAGGGAAPVWEEDGWVWDEGEQAWRTQRPDGSWEWEWEYEAREAGMSGDPRRQGDKARRSMSPSWRGDYKPQVDEAGRELPRAYAPVGEEEDDSDDSSSDSDSSSESDLERQRAAERALRKYKKSHKRRAFEDEMEKQRKKLLKVEEKLRKHKERKKRKKEKVKASKRARPQAPGGSTGGGAPGGSPPRQYPRTYEEGEVDMSGDEDVARSLPDSTDIFHGPRLKQRDKGETYGPDPGGGSHDGYDAAAARGHAASEGFRDFDYRLPQRNPFGDRDERQGQSGGGSGAPERWPEAQAPQEWPRGRRDGWSRGGRGASISRGGTRGGPAQAPQAFAQEEFTKEEFQQEAPPPRSGCEVDEFERQRFGRRREFVDERREEGHFRERGEGGDWDNSWRDPPPYTTTDTGGPSNQWRRPDDSFRGGAPRGRGTSRDWRSQSRDPSDRASSVSTPQRGPSSMTPRVASPDRSMDYDDRTDHGPSYPGGGDGDQPGLPSDAWRRPGHGPPPPASVADSGLGDERRCEANMGEDAGAPRGVKRKYDDTADSRSQFHRNPSEAPEDFKGFGNNSDYKEYANYFGFEDALFREAALEPAWVRSTPADLYFRREKNSSNVKSTNKMADISDYFEQNLVLRATAIRENKPKYEKKRAACPVILHSISSSESEAEEDDVEDEINKEMQEEIERKQSHPERLHPELWFNEAGESNTGPYCRCSIKQRTTGIRHSIYPGDEPYPVCEPDNNNWDRLYHYRLSVSPVTNFLLKDPTVINHDRHEYVFEGFSLFSHYRINSNVPQCKVVRFNIEYTLHWIEEDPPTNYDIRSIDLFQDYLMEEILELYDLNLRCDEGGCRKFHFMPRFARPLPDNGKEILSMDVVLSYLIKANRPLITKEELARLVDHTPHQWADFVDTIRGSVITNPGMRPSSLRIDQLDKEGLTHDNLVFPQIVHFGMKPSRITYVGHPEYNKLWKQFVKFRHLLAFKPKVTTEDKQKCKNKEEQLMNLRLKKSLKREVTVALDSKDWLKTGFNADICQHALMLPVLISHLRFHKCLDHLEKKLRYTFKNRQLLQFALTHPSYRYGTVNYGTNPDHARNSMFNCGMRCPEFGNKNDWIKVHRKRGINVLIKIMAKMAKKEEQASVIDNYERLEFLGDAVVEFITTVHLYFMLPDAPEGVLATYRSAIVQNQHLTELAKALNLQDYFLFAHGPDLCHESEIRHALANCFEALMGAVFIDGGIEVADRIFGEAFFKDQPALLETWHKLPLHPLQEDEPAGDRHWIEKSVPLQKLVEFEGATGIEFDHIRLLARSFTVRNVGYTSLTLGHNQRMEFLGDSVMQLVVSEYVYKHFPEHHEGHLSLLRQCLVNNKTQCQVCEDLCMEKYMITTSQRTKGDLSLMKTKEKADLIEAFIGALYVDKGLEWVKVFLRVCFFPRLKEFIMLGDWNDPKSRLQQCCLLRRDPGEETPEMPKYKVLESKGPTNTRVYRVAVYFKGARLADADGASIQQAEMKAAQNALDKKEELFPLLKYHKSYLKQKFKDSKKMSDLSEGSEFFETKIPEDEIVPFEKKPEVGSNETSRPEIKMEMGGEGAVEIKREGGDHRVASDFVISRVKSEPGLSNA